MYSFFLNAQFGFYTWIVNTLHLPLPISLFSQSGSALVTVALTDVWEWTPYLALMFLAGLQSIDTESYEAAKMDGANAWQTFTRITVPLMMPVIVVGIILRSMEAFKEFDKPYILTGGGARFRNGGNRHVYIPSGLCVVQFQFRVRDLHRTFHYSADLRDPVRKICIGA